MTLARWQATIVDDAGSVQAAASVEVRKESDGLLASLFSDRAGVTPIANPATAGADGFAYFHAAGGAYKITATKGAFTREWRYAAVGTAAEADLVLFKVLDANAAGADSATAQPWFPTAGAVSVAAGTWYKFRGILRISRAAGAVAHTTGVLFAGTATLTQINWFGRAKEGDANDLQDISGFWSLAATEQVLKAASTSTTEQVLIEVIGMVKINAAGTFIPQFKYSAAPGGAPSVLAGSFFEMVPLGSLNTNGTWA